MLDIPPANNNRPFQVLAGTSPGPSHCSTVPDLHGWGIPSEQGGKFSLPISCWNKSRPVQRSQVNQLQGERSEDRAEMPGIGGGAQSPITVLSQTATSNSSQLKCKSQECFGWLESVT